MIKIRAPHLSDFQKLKELLKDNPSVEKILFFLLQPIIPHNSRFVPSIHIAVERGNILGYVILKCASKLNNCWQIDNVYVQDEMRNKGVGEELIKYVLSLYGGYGIEHFIAEVDFQNFPALTLFHECGFRRYAKYCFYEKEINVKVINESPLHDREFILRQQTSSDLNEVEKLELSTIPPDLRPVLGRAKEYFGNKKNAKVLSDQSRNLIIGWANIEKISEENCLVELLAHPGWTHLYEDFLNTIISDCLALQSNKFKLTVKVVDYLAELTQILGKKGFLPTQIKELLVRSVWQKVKERKSQTTRGVVPRTAPT